MNRDMELARRILRAIEAAPFDGGEVTLDLPDVQNDILQYHLLLLKEADLIQAIDASSMDGPVYLPIRLTWGGHEFLEASRDETIWTKARTTVLKKTGGLAFDVLLTVLKEYARQAVLGS